MAPVTSWTDFFDRLRGDSPLYREQAAIYVTTLAAHVRLHSTQRVLDFGCGFGYVARLLAPMVGQVWLWDSSAAMRRAAARNTEDHANIRSCDLSTDNPAQELRGLDLILVNSVMQYMSHDEVSDWLPRWHRMLAPGGQVVISDLIPVASRPFSDPIDLIKLAARYDSPLRAAGQAIGGLLNYWSVARSVPLTRISEEYLTAGSAEAGFGMRVLPSNLTHFRRRWAAVLEAPAGKHA